MIVDQEQPELHEQHDEQQPAKPNYDAMLATARKRFQLASDAETRIREEALEDLRFRAGDQWPPEIKSARDVDKRPCLTINRLPGFLKQITNEQRQNRPSIQVSPVDSNGDPDTAEVLQGLIRHIEADSHADVAYDTAFESAATHGFGYFRIIAEYDDGFSFDQSLKIRRIRNPFRVYFDPTAQEPDKSDAQWCFVVETLSHDTYRQEYPESELASFNDLSSIGDRAAHWVTTDSVRVAEYFYIERERRKIAKLADGSVAFADELPEGAPVVATRETLVPRVKWCKLNGAEVLDERDWPGRWIPVVPVLGDELEIDGELQLSGVVRFARDPQRMYNFWATAEAETVALAPKAPFIAAEGQIEGNEHLWKAANTKNIAVLPYKPREVGGLLVPPPQRQFAEPPIRAISEARLQAADDLKATTGIYDASLGARGNETSGKAILARQKEGDTANYHYTDNLARALRHAGRILIDLIPHIYDTPRVLRIIGEDRSAKTVKVNQPFSEGGVQKIYDLTTGKYDVVVSTGPSYTSKRTEAVESMMSLTQAYPALVPMIGDLMVSAMDWPGAKDIAARLKKMLPPELQDQDDETPIPPKFKALLQQLTAQHEQLTAALNDANHKLEVKSEELASRERIALAQIEADLAKSMATIASKEALAELQHQMSQISERMQMLDRAAAQEAQQQHARELQASDQAAAAEAQQAAAEQEPAAA